MKPKTGSTGTLLSKLTAKTRSEKGEAFCSTSDPNNDKTLGRALVIGYIILLIILSISQVVSSFAQAPSKGLQIGDTIPEKVWHLPLQVAGHHENKSTITLNDYRGKLIILDFWATWCGSCIAAMPGTHKLENQFKDQLVILPVTYEQPEKAALFLKTNTYIKDLSLFSITGDTVLKQLFPHRVIPHYVWIGRNGMVEAITATEQVNTVNIRKVINGSSVHLNAKTDLDAERPLFLSDAVEVNSIQHYSVLTEGKFDGFSSGSRTRRINRIVRGRAVTNSSILSIYSIAVRPLFKELNDSFSEKRLISELKGDQSARLFNYELIVSPEDAPRLYHLMLDDLNQSSPYTGLIERRNVRCLVLVSKGKMKEMAAKGGKSENTLFYKSPGKLVNSPVSGLVSRLNAAPWINLPVVDGTGFTGNIDLTLPLLTSLEPLKRALDRLGLDLKEEQWELPMLVVRDKNVNNAIVN